VSLWWCQWVKGTAAREPPADWYYEGDLDGNKAGELWAIALSEDGQYLASTTHDGRINVWDTVAERTKIREYETKGSFGMCIDLVSNYGDAQILIGTCLLWVNADDAATSLPTGGLRLLDMRMEVSISSTMIPAACCIRFLVYPNYYSASPHALMPLHRPGQTSPYNCLLTWRKTHRRCWRL
jgi:WD40 repeat protein